MDFAPGDPALMLTVLRSAEANLDRNMLLRRVLSLFCTDDDGNQVAIEDGPDLQRRIDTAIANLQMAGLIRVTTGDELSITSLGTAMMMAYPLGIDDGVLCSLPAFRNRVYETNAPVMHERHLPNSAYGSGFSAGLDAHRLTENPYPSDSRDHEDWLMGWDEALDQSKREAETLLN
jgi:restriction endonuclease Mrr